MGKLWVNNGESWVDNDSGKWCLILAIDVKGKHAEEPFVWMVNHFSSSHLTEFGWLRLQSISLHHYGPKATADDGPENGIGMAYM